MPAPHYYPVGVQVFERVREPGMLYVDKTRYIWDMTRPGGRYWFLSRPRRFGKTLLVSTMEAYFQGRRELFEGLYLGEHEGEWKSSPVLRLDLSGVKATDEKTLRECLDYVLEPYERDLGTWTSDARTSYSARLARLIDAAYERDGEVVVLVDEYDSPMLTVMNDATTLERFREVMRDLYSPLKSREGKLRFVFLTGVSKFSQLSIFSELNNLNNISMDTKYAGICGITAEELENDLSADVEWLGEQLGLSREQTKDALRARYDGYHFARKSPDIYNPFSLVMTLQKESLGSWWFGSGTPTVLTQTLRRYEFNVPELEGVEAQASSFDAPTEAMATPVPLLYQSGYLTIKDYDPELDMYLLGIPNAEVSQGLYEALLPHYTGIDSIDRDSFILSFARALRHNDLDDAIRRLRSFLAGIPYDLAAKDEKAFQSQLFIVFKVLGSRISTEVRTATGRIDVTLQTATTLFVIELKYNGTAQAALAQIDQKGYLIPFLTGEKALVKAGINYSSKERTIEEGWLIEQASD